jgi:hypothetical protein
MHRYEVGKPYSPTRAKWPEAIDFNWRGGGFEMRMFLRGPTGEEIDGIGKGRAEFALHIESPAIFLLYRFVPGMAMWSDAPYSYHLAQRALPEEVALPDILPSPQSRDLLSIILVDADSGLVKALREVSFSPEFSRALRQGVRDTSASAWPGDAQYDRLLKRVYARFPTSADMARAATVRCTGGQE